MTPPPNRLEEITAKIKAQDYRMTPQRMAILKALIDNPEHPTVEQIHAEVEENFPMTSLATTYKMVRLLKEMGEILEINPGNGKAHYDGATPNPHPHLICTHCQSVIDLDLPALEELPLKSEVVQSTGYKITRYQFDFFGICPQCQEKELS